MNTKLNLAEKWLFIILMTQYMGALGQYYIVLDNLFEQVWSILYILVRLTLFVYIAMRSLSGFKGKIKVRNLAVIGAIVFLLSISVAVSTTKIDTIGFIFRLGTTILISWYFAVNYEIKRIVNYLCISQIIFMAINLTFILLFPNYAYFTDSSGQRVLTALFTTKNGCAYELIFGAILFYHNFRMSRGIKRNACLILSLLHLCLTIECRALGAIVTGIACVVFSEILVSSRKRIRLDVLYLAANVGFLVTVIFGLPALSAVLKVFGRDATLTGRTDIWLSIWQFLKSGNILFGYGYESVWDNQNITDALYRFYSLNHVRYNYTGAHNSFVELLMYFGVVGLGIYLFVALNLLKRNQIFTGYRGLFVLLIFIFFTLHGLVERSLSDSSYDTVMFVMMLTYIARLGNNVMAEDIQGLQKKRFLHSERCSI